MSEARPTFGGRGPTVGVLDEEERRAVQRLFGVAAEQVARDHVVSHALAAIAELGPDHQCLVRVTPDVAVAVVEAALESAAGGAEAPTRET